MKYESRHAGKQAKCPSCNNSIQFPKTQEMVEEEPVESSEPASEVPHSSQEDKPKQHTDPKPKAVPKDSASVLPTSKVNVAGSSGQQIALWIIAALLAVHLGLSFLTRSVHITGVKTDNVSQVRVIRDAGKEWEYKIESPSDTGFVKEMDALGDEGWELVFARRARNSLDKYFYEVILKRRKK